MTSLTKGALEKILNGTMVDKPVLQLLGYKKMPANNMERYRLVLSDGQHYITTAMLGTQHNHRINSGELDKFCITKLDNYIMNTMQGDKNSSRKVVIILEISVVVSGSDLGEQIGTPILLSDTSINNESKIKMEQENAPPVVNSNNRYDRASVNPHGQNLYPGINSSNSGASDRLIQPIVSLTPYQNKWTIRVRAVNKTPIKTWSNSRGEGKLFSVDFVDESGEIRATAFNAQCDRYFDQIQVNKVFYVSRCTLKSANKKFSSIKNDYEMTFTNDTTVEVCYDNLSSVPTTKFNFTPINALEEIEKDTLIDVIGVVKSVSDLQTVTTRTTNKEVKKKELQLVDQTNTEVTLTVWNNEAEQFNDTGNPIIAIKGVKVNEFGGRTLSTTMGSTLHINPPKDLPEYIALEIWIQKNGLNAPSNSLSNKGRTGAVGGAGTVWKTIGQSKLENLGASDKADYYCVKAYITMVRKENCMYQACPSEECNKKVIDQNNGMFRCEKCNRDYQDFKWRLLLSLNIADNTDNQWVNAFQESAEIILGKSAQELGDLKMKEENGDGSFSAVFSRTNFAQYLFKLRTKMETYNDENRMKTSVASVSLVDYKAYHKRLMEEIEKLRNLN